MNKAWISALLLLLASPAVLAEATARLSIPSAWARATAPGATVAAVYLEINNASAHSDRLLSLSSARASKTSVHRTVIENDVARMLPVSLLHLRPGERVMMAPGGLHLMLDGLQAPLKAGEEFTVVLKFELHGEMRVPVQVQEAVEGTGRAAGHHH